MTRAELRYIEDRVTNARKQAAIADPAAYRALSTQGPAAGSIQTFRSSSHLQQGTPREALQGQVQIEPAVRAFLGGLTLFANSGPSPATMQCKIGLGSGKGSG